MSSIHDSILAPFLPAHLRLLERWLAAPHVARWYPLPERDMEIASSPPPGGAHAVIVSGGTPVGYVRWQRVTRETLDELGLQEIPAGAVDIDILLGDAESVGRGIGPAALAALAAELLRDPDVPMLGLTTSVDNTRAHRAFAKAGFVITRQYDPNGLGPCHLMLRDLRRERSSTTWPMT
jgi:RimJ/RimL family protein N-acetyltransferase